VYETILAGLDEIICKKSRAVKIVVEQAHGQAQRGRGFTKARRESRTRTNRGVGQPARGTLEHMSVSRRPPAADRLLAAELCGVATHHAKWRDLTEDEHAAAVAELRELAAGRADLLAEEAGLLIGFYEGTINEPVKCNAARLLIASGADESLVPQWVQEGRRRRPY
jgi:hypothetical protein